MFKPEIFTDIANKITSALPIELADLKANSSAIIKELLSDYFAKMHLVTKQEFDVQAALLLKTKQQLASLEARLAELEQK